MQKIIAANWKMHKTRRQAAECAATMAEALGLSPLDADRLGIVFAPYTDIPIVADAFSGVRGMAVGAQNFYPEKEGAFTGEISPAMLAEAGASWLLTGHSERRHIFGEDDALVARKTAYGLANGFKVMLCIGETLAQREAGQLESVLDTQLASALENLRGQPATAAADCLAIAYEPVWAIGTGKVAGPGEVAEAHAMTRRILTRILGDRAAGVAILYGGSVKPANAGELLELDNVDGLLVGGASLEADSFLQILNA